MTTGRIDSAGNIQFTGHKPMKATLLGFNRRAGKEILVIHYVGVRVWDGKYSPACIEVHEARHMTRDGDGFKFELGAILVWFHPRYGEACDAAMDALRDVIE